MEKSEEFQPGSWSQESSSRGGRPKKQQQYVAGVNSGKWSELQNTKYIVYIEYHRDKMRSREKRRVTKLYHQMSKFIGTRNALQCRSHHQKLEDRYHYPNKIIAHFKLLHNPLLYQTLTLELQSYQTTQTSPLISTPKLTQLPISHLSCKTLSEQLRGERGKDEQNQQLRGWADEQVRRWEEMKNRLYRGSWWIEWDSWLYFNNIGKADGLMLFLI